jgi:hypothetical protein
VKLYGPSGEGVIYPKWEIILPLVGIAMVIGSIAVVNCHYNNPPDPNTESTTQKSE